MASIFSDTHEIIVNIANNINTIFINLINTMPPKTNKDAKGKQLFKIGTPIKDVVP